MTRAERILTLAAAHSSAAPGQIDPTNLFGPGRIEGDDAGEFWQAFAAEFTVDLSTLRAYLHYNGNEPPTWRTAWGIAPNGRRLPDIPISLADLMAAARLRPLAHDLSRPPPAPDHLLLWPLNTIDILRLALMLLR